MRLDAFDFDLPEDRIALRPASRATPRACWSCGRTAGSKTEACATCRTLLRPGDALVFNDTRVIPARLNGVRERDGLGRGGRGDPAPTAFRLALDRLLQARASG